MSEAHSINILDWVRVSGVAAGIMVLALTWLLDRFQTATLRGIGARITERRLQLSQVSSVLSFLLYAAGMALAAGLAFRLSKDVMIALGGTVAVALGFALKDMATSIIAGIVVIVDRPFQVGDRVTFAGFYGEVAEIGLRAVRLVTLDDNVVTIPTSRFLTEAVASGNRGALDMMVPLDFHIGPNEDLRRAKAIVEESLQTSRFVYNRKPWAVLVSQVLLEHHVCVRLRAKAYVLDVRYEQDFATDVTERVLLAFSAAGIRAPELHVTTEAAARPAEAAA